MTPVRSIPRRKVEAAMTNLSKMTTALADELRVIADDIWSGKLNQFHAANKLRKYADRISKVGR